MRTLSGPGTVPPTLASKLLPHLLASESRWALAVFCDFRKAYDTVDRKFLLAILERLGAGAGFLSWVSLLLTNTRAAALVNGCMSSPVRFLVGVRQGCPLAPLLYLFVALALLCFLKAKGVGVSAGGQQLPASQYADDTEAFLEGGSIAATCQRVGAFLAAMRTFASASGQHLNPTKTKLLPIGASPPFLPPTIHGLEVVHTAEGLGITLNSGTQPPSADWQALLQKVEASYTKLSCLGLSAFGRGFGSTAYGTSKLLFHAEYAGPLPPACAAQLDSWTARLVDGGRAPSNRQRGFTGVKGELLAAPPACGGFGTLPWQEHISARHAGWGLRLVMAGQPAQQRNPPPAAASASQQTGPAAASQAEQTTPMPPWAAVARQLLRNIHPSFKPSHLLTLPAGHHWAAQLPAPLRRMHLGLRMLPAPELTAPPPAPGPWCCATPIWGNPLLELLDGRTLADAFPLVAAIYPDARIRCLEMAFAAANSPLQLFNPYLHPLRQQLAALLSLIPVPWRQAAWDHGQAGASLDQQAGLRPILPLVGWQLEGSSSAVALPRYSVRHGTRLQQLQPGQPGQPSAHLQRLQRLAAFAALAVAPPPRAPVQLQPTPQPPTQPPPASLTAAQAEAAPVLRLLARLWKLKWHNSHKEVATRPIVPDGLAADLQRQLAQLKRISEDMEALWRMQIIKETGAKRDMWKNKVEQVVEETYALKTGLDRFAGRERRRHLEEQQRQELLDRRAGGGAILDLNANLAARRHVESSKRILEEAYQTGVGMLTDMSGQRERLKATHRKVLDVLNRVGLSDSLLRLADRRQRLDKLLVYGGMLVVMLVLGLLYWWLKA
ncbi:hypothetical protein N2152v2_007472 [Parachlorella kessleri]